MADGKTTGRMNEFIESVRQEIKEFCNRESDNGANMQFPPLNDEKLDLLKSYIAELYVAKKAIEDGVELTDNEVKEQAKNYKDSIAIAAYFHGKKSEGILLNLGYIRHEDDRIKAKDIEDTLFVTMKEAEEKKEFFAAFDKLEEAEKEKYVNLSKKVGNLDGKEQHLTRAKQLYADTVYGEQEFEKIINAMPNPLTGPAYDNAKKDFMELWMLNQTIKAHNSNAAVSTQEVFDIATMPDQNRQLAIDAMNKMNEQRRLMAKSVAFKEPEFRSLMEEKYDDVHVGAVTRCTGSLFDHSSPQAEKENDKILAKLNGMDQKARNNQLLELYKKAINDVLSIPDKDLVPENDEEAYRVFTTNYPKLYLAFEVQNAIGQMAQEVNIPQNIREALKHKTDLYQLKASRYLEKFQSESNPDYKKKMLFSKVGLEAITSAASTNAYHALPMSDVGLGLQAGTLLKKEEALEKDWIKGGFKVDPKYDGLHVDNLEYTPEYDEKQHTLSNYLKSQKIIGEDYLLEITRENGKRIPEASYGRFSNEKIKVRAFKPGDPIGITTYVTYSKEAGRAHTKPEPTSVALELNDIAKNPDDQLKRLERMQELILGTDPLYVLTNSQNFKDVKANLSDLIKSHKALGPDPNAKQLAELWEKYEKLDQSCNKYLEEKGDKLKNVRESGKKDERGEFRYNIIKSLSSITNEDHIWDMFEGYPKFKEAKAETNDYELIDDLMDSILSHEIDTKMKDGPATEHQQAILETKALLRAMKKMNIDPNAPISENMSQGLLAEKITKVTEHMISINNEESVSTQLSNLQKDKDYFLLSEDELKELSDIKDKFVNEKKSINELPGIEEAKKQPQVKNKVAEAQQEVKQ